MRHLRAALILPGTVTVAIPTVLVLVGGAHWGWSWIATAAGALAAALGLTFLLWTARLFYRVGQGTLAPWHATQRLVVVGPYRHVRNPMISGVIFILLGEALLAGSPLVGGWCALFALGNMVYIPLSEEPGLRKRFGNDYDRYAAAVPRWVPRLRAWNPER